MLSSLFASNPNTSFKIHLLHDYTTDGNDLSSLQSWIIERRHSISCYNAEVGIPDNVPVHSRFSAAAWFRVLLPDLLPELDRVIYLDVDLVVVKNIAPLWNTKLDTKLVAASTNPFYPNMSMVPVYKLGITHGSDYFNSGVLLLDLKGLRVFGLAKKVFALASSDPAITRFADQDPLNAVLHQHCLLLSPAWNAQSPYFDLSTKQLSSQGISVEGIQAARLRPAIIHYSGPWKPWNFRCSHPKRALYKKYRQCTPWPELTVRANSPWDYFWRSLSTAKQVQLSLRLTQLKFSLKHFYKWRNRPNTN